MMLLACIVSFIIGCSLVYMINYKKHVHDWEFMETVSISSHGSKIAEFDLYRCKSCGEYKKVVKYGGCWIN